MRSRRMCRIAVVVVALGIASGCATYTDRLKERLNDISASKEQREAADSATCQRYGAQPGTDIYVTCMVGLAQARASRAATVSAPTGPPPLPGFQNIGPALPDQQPTTCRPIPYSAQNSPYGMTSYRCQ